MTEPNPAERYQTFFVPLIGAPMAQTLIRKAAPSRGERVLDVGCGTGVVTRMLEERVSESGSVTGLDAHPIVIAVARSTTGAGSSIVWLKADAESIPLPDASLDLVTCQMSLQFFRNKLAALREMRRVLAPGGRLALNVPGPLPAVFAVIAKALSRHVGREAAAFCNLVFSLHDPDELRELATAAGFREVAVTAENIPLTAPLPSEFLWGYIASTPLASKLEGIDPAHREALERDVREGLQRFVTGEKLLLEVQLTTLMAR